MPANTVLILNRLLIRPTQPKRTQSTVILSLAGGGSGGCVRGLNIDRYTTTNLDKPGVDSCDTFSIDDQHTE